MQLKIEHLTALGISLSNARTFLPFLNRELKRFKVTRRANVCALLAQLCQESGCFRYTAELWDGKGAQARYDTRADLGNTPERDGDGKENRGFGLIQTTGAANQREALEKINRLLGTNYDTEDGSLLAQPELAVISAFIYWKDHGCEALANRLDGSASEADIAAFDRITKRINGGYNHAAERRAFYRRALRAIKSDLTFISPQPISNEPLSPLAPVATNEPGTPSPAPAQPIQPDNPAPTQSTDASLIDSIPATETTRALAANAGRSLLGKLVKPFSMLIGALLAGDVWAWLGLIVFVGAIGYLAHKHRGLIALYYRGKIKPLALKLISKFS